jgi:orotate phosphoribosyltransferase
MDLMKVFEQKKALLKGHFLLSSGLHSEYYLQCALILQYPDIASQLADLLTEKIVKNGFNKTEIDIVLSPAIGGIVIGQELARSISGKTRSLFTERDPKSGKMILRRGFEIKPDDKIIVVEDVVTTGGTTKELIELVSGIGATVTCACSMVDRTADKIKFDVPLISLLQLNVQSFTGQECPLCKNNTPVIKPGSKNK